MPSPICVGCQREMGVAKNDCAVNDQAVSGFASTTWLGDRYRCPGCAAEVVTGFGKGMAGRVEQDSIEFTR